MERALQLFTNKMIEERVDSKGIKKLVVQKLQNPRTGNQSGLRQEFSTAGWNQATLDYFSSIKNLSAHRLTVIFDEAQGLVVKGIQRFKVSESDKSACATLQSDDELGGEKIISL